MSLHGKILLYLVAIHALLAVVAAVAFRERPALLFAAEGLFALSIVVALYLVRALFVPLRLVRTGTELIAERDFATRFREVGQLEMDQLIRVYNRMVEQLREERLKIEEQHHLLSRILEVSPAGIVILDFEGRIALHNPAAATLLQLPAAGAVGLRLDEAGSPTAAALAGVARGPARILSQQGSQRLRCTQGEFLDRGFPRRFFLVEDVTEELRNSERAAYHKLIRLMSHEVANSVGPVASLLDSCRAYGDQLDAESRRDFEEAIEVASTRMRHLNAFMSGFAEVVRLPPPDLRPCDVRALLDDLLVLLRPELARRSIAVLWEADEPLPPLALDKNQIEQALVNILQNALEAIGERGRLALRWERRGDRPFLSIRDTGGGLSPEAETALFTPFFSTKRDGRGLGLTVVQEVLSQHHLDFGIHNRAGEGAEFWIAFGPEMDLPGGTPYNGPA